MKIWIIGAGTFGRRAVRQLAQSGEPHEITLVDPDPHALNQADLPGLIKVEADGVAFLAEHLRHSAEPDWIVPALPVHLAWEWALKKLTQTPGEKQGKAPLIRKVLPAALAAALPNAMAGDSGDIYVSHADFICPAHCNEPDHFCTKTGDPRKEDLFRLLARLGAPDLPAFVIQSLQLGPGLGGYQPAVLFDLADRLEQHRGPCFVATACRCHGVVTGGCRI